MKPSIFNQRPARAAFTLVESLLVIVITAILAVLVSGFIRLPFIAYVDSAARAELTDVADITLRRMSREIRLALPNSLRVKDERFLELLLTKTGGRYLQEDDGLAGNPLQFEVPGLDCTATPSAAACAFTVVGAMPELPNQIVAGDRIAVYNLGIAPADAYTEANLATVSQVQGNLVSLSNNPFALQDPPLRSPTRRFQVVTTPLSYFCDGKLGGGSGRLLRYDNYPLTVDQATPPVGGRTTLLADGVEECKFSYGRLANLRSGLLRIEIRLKRSGGETGVVQLYHQVHVNNTP